MSPSIRIELCHASGGALALVDLDLHRRLTVVGRGEDLRALGRERGVDVRSRSGPRWKRQAGSS
jgi:NAD-specific glutamate dehydrogenase